MEAEEVEEAVVLVVAEVSHSSQLLSAQGEILIYILGRGGFQQRDNGPPSDVFGENRILALLILNC